MARVVARGEIWQWSPLRGELIYFDKDGTPTRGRKAKAVAPMNNMWDYLWVSARGTISVAGHVFDGERPAFKPQGNGRSCGFAGTSRLVRLE